jgi:hypothetical protein
MAFSGTSALRIITGLDSGARGLAARVLRPVLKTSLGPPVAIRIRPTAKFPIEKNICSKKIQMSGIS